MTIEEMNDFFARSFAASVGMTTRLKSLSMSAIERLSNSPSLPMINQSPGAI